MRVLIFKNLKSIKDHSVRINEAFINELDNMPIDEKFNHKNYIKKVYSIFNKYGVEAEHFDIIETNNNWFMIGVDTDEWEILLQDVMPVIYTKENGKIKVKKINIRS